ncbi:General substrate transporter [Novosphingobium aromaticivorans DSM 12444]|uniref:General substrate transporter n=1 Tax=Novosphingobium aromaticivorans (strain ATCC 700278 / DSM 12444 / CCUG 56034 / CIP 105152 / NBRC 16084 / F199) TaxID=279238 RepID=Q2G6I7_NOVAD|nr:MFS transporter [Novosphingobium aromaticivorans]ABD26536.1 General substrate transporter [Novosphingobium aromaticivorans DSM 12444]SCY76058.1 Predicted arabinose efflux permease, MFS family [Novosphingobium aromaticivorans]
MAAQTLDERRLARRAVIAATTGNALEFYDFITFSFFAIQIGRVFFPSEDPFVSLMASLATFGVGFIGRPLGAWAIGAWADRHGRKPAMLLSMTLMGISVAVLALTPSHAAIGAAAPVIVVLARLVQGFALGGEVGSATTYMMECASHDRRAWAISWQGASQAIASSAGSLVGLGLSLVLTPDQLTDWGWRVALLAGTVIVPFSLVIRRSLPETIDAPDHVPAGHIPPGVWRTVVLGMMMVSGATIATYLFNYMATYGQNTLGFTASVSLGTTLAVNVARFAAILLGGWLSDRFGRRPLMILPWAVFAAAIVPAYVWLTSAHDAFVFIAVNTALAFCSTVPSGAVYAAIAESLPKASRAKTFALVYALPVTFLGGSTQFVITWLLKVTGEPMAVAWYMLGAALLALAGMVLVRESAPSRLRASPA